VSEGSLSYPLEVSYPRVIPRSEHPLSRKDVWPEALKVIRRLGKFGHTAYLVGGGVRDLVLDKKPKDFDVATDATPEEVRRLFNNSRIIGKRFRLVQVYFRGGKVVEVSTFRREPDAQELEGIEDSYSLNNLYGSPYQDVMRRDFTINALFYNPKDFTIIDYVGGWGDIHRRVIRAIGNPEERFAEDPVRMTRAVEFAGRLGFSLHPSVEEAIKNGGWRITQAFPERLREEILGILLSGASGRAMDAMSRLGLVSHLFPRTQEIMVPHMDEVVSLLVKADGSLRRDSPWVSAQFLALLLLPWLKSLCPFSSKIILGQTLEVIIQVVVMVKSDLLLSAHLSHSTKELLLALWRVARGPKARGAGRFMEKECFQAAMDLFKVESLVYREDKVLLEQWRERGGRKRKPFYRNRPRGPLR